MKPTLAILIETPDGTTTLPISRITQIKTDKEMIVFEKIGDGWRLTYSQKTIPELERLTMLRLVKVDAG